METLQEYSRGQSASVADILNKINQASKSKTVPVTTVAKALKSKKVNLQDKLDLIKIEAINKLDKYVDDTITIKTKEALIKYIDAAIENNIIAIDTETNNSLDPLTCKLMGPCIYTPGQKNAYIPINHVDLESGERLSWQLTEKDIAEQFARLENTYIVMHNAKFDIQVIKCTCGLELHCDWDTLVGARMLDENELAGLKYQYRTKVDPTQEKYDIESLFGDIEYAILDPDLFALYSGTDPFITYKLYEYQKKQFEQKGNERLYALFKELEMPLVPVVADMELQGVCLDLEYSERLKAKYSQKLTDADKAIEDELAKYKNDILLWRCTEDAQKRFPALDKETGQQKRNAKGELVFKKSKSEQLANPPKITSPTQMAILFYDVLKMTSPDKKNPRGTGEDIIKTFGLPLCDLILERRSLGVLYNTFIEKLPKCISPADGRLHCHFNANGTATGRFSSSDPNLQNIPSGEHAIRLMFTASKEDRVIKPINGLFRLYKEHEVSLSAGAWKAASDVKIGDSIVAQTLSGVCNMVILNLQVDPCDDNWINFQLAPEATELNIKVPYKFIGSDYSGQEPRMLCAYSQDEYFQQALKEGKDPYATIGTKVFHNNYEDNLEHHADGSLYPEGNKRRKKCKTILLGLMYGMTLQGTAERLGTTVEEAKAINDSFFNGFPGIKKWMEANLDGVHKKGYVEDLWGRRRRLPDANLPMYTIEPKRKDRKTEIAFTPLVGTRHLVGPKDAELVEYYRQRIASIEGQFGFRVAFNALKEEALENDIIIINNSAFISQAERQVTNAAIQGGAATLTKRAMLNLYHDSLMKQYGFRLLIGVHDELIGEVPAEFAEQAAQRLSEVMCEAGKPLCQVQMKCDAMVFPGVPGKSSWYADVYFVDIQDEYQSYLSENTSKEAMQKLINNHPEFTSDELAYIITMQL